MMKFIKKSWENQFSFKLFVIITLLFTLFSVLAIGIFINQQIKNIEQKYISEGKLLTTILANNSRLGVFAENEFLLEEPISDILKTPEVISVTLYLANGKPLKHSSKKTEGSTKVEKDIDVTTIPLIDKPINKRYSYEFWSPIYTTSHELIEQLFVPDFSERIPKKQKIIGYVKLEIDKTGLIKNIQTLLIKGFIIYLIFIIFWAIIIYKLTKKMTLSLNNLADKLSLFGKEGVSEYVKVESKDEIGKVAMAFNNMIDALKDREREKQALEAQLRQSQKLEAIGTLAGGIAHDFNNVLTAIINCATLIKMYSKDEQINTYSDVILRASERASSLTKSLLAFSRKQTVKPQVVDINAVIKDFQNILKRLIMENVTFELNCSEHELPVSIDITQLDQLIVNLVTNACDAMPDGGTLTITTEYNSSCEDLPTCEVPCPCAVIRVSDTGIGIDPKIIDKIFDPFFTTKEVGKGTGLGLAMVHGIVKQNNGKIKVDSTPGVGTTFSIYFPISKKEEQIDTKKSEFKLEDFTLLKEKANILLAEDDMEVRTVISSILKATGYNVFIAKDGEEAIEIYSKNKDIINLSMLDVMMPKKNGKQVADFIRSIDPNAKILFFSGYTADILDNVGLDSSTMIISKPLDPEGILKHIQNILKS
ncbi:MAG: ATP-binding protein [Proteobacteria bacterium]|nr:ATP-binding protein [Pseudomonadota bacterium]